nr:putative helicase MOV-10 [Pelodiscus sinensis]|eukprot:XP_025038226.1 putative helicase MOV-10 [Pelodiscus sinensis]
MPRPPGLASASPIAPGNAAPALTRPLCRRCRDGTREPNFSSVLFALCKSGLAEVRGDFVRFGKVKKRVKIRDQYWTPEEPPADSQEPGTERPPARGRAKKRAEFIQGKHGVEILSEHDQGNGRIRFSVTPTEPATTSIWVQNNGQEAVTLLGYRALRRQHELTFHDEGKVTKQQPRVLAPGDSYAIEVRCLTQLYGYFPATLLFQFTKEPDGPFAIGRFVSAVASSRLAQELGPSAPYKPYQAKLKKSVTVITEEGFPPDSTQPPETAKLKQLIPLGHYRYPESLKDTVGTAPSSLRSALLRPQVPGVAENRPSVLRGDHLFVSRSEQRGAPHLVRYKGYVHAVELERVKLGFSSTLLDSFVDKLKFDVTFTFNRLPLRVQHRAVELAEKRRLSCLLFPSFSLRQSLLPEGAPLRLFDRSLETNQEQSGAVRQIATGLSRPAPYIIFGPPGTGKTVTMVEAIKQVAHCIEGSHILACAPSNSASDLLCQRLLKHLDKGRIYRLNASSRDFRQVPEEIKPCCNWDPAQQCHVYPGKEELQHFRVIVTTLVTAGRGRVTGPCQAGGRVTGLLSLADVSLLERLMLHNTLYQRGAQGYDPQFVTKLLRNYRCRVRPGGTDSARGACWSGAAKPCTNGSQLLQSQGRRGRASLSPKEIGIISPYRKQVEKIRLAITRLDPELKQLPDIKELKVGSVEEFQGQERRVILVSTVRSCPEFLAMDEKFKLGFLKNPKVGAGPSAALAHRALSWAGELGVALATHPHSLPTRFPRPLLSGGPHQPPSAAVLCKDPHWGTFLKYCVEQGGYTGCTYTPESPEEEALADELSSLPLDTEPAGTPAGESHVQQQLGPGWRHEH